METLRTHFRGSALTLYINHQLSKEHPGHRAQCNQRCCQCPAGQDQSRPDGRGTAEVAKAAQNTSRGPREKAELRAVFVLLCEPTHARAGNTWPTVHIALCCTCCRAPTATELGGNSHYTLRGQTRNHIFNCPQETLIPTWEVGEEDENCLAIPSSFSNSLVPTSFPTAYP